MEVRCQNKLTDPVYSLLLDSGFKCHRLRTSNSISRGGSNNYQFNNISDVIDLGPLAKSLIVC